MSVGMTSRRKLARNRRGIDDGLWAIAAIAVVGLIVWLKGTGQVEKWAHALGRGTGAFRKGKAEIESEIAGVKAGVTK